MAARLPLVVGGINVVGRWISTGCRVFPRERVPGQDPTGILLH